MSYTDKDAWVDNSKILYSQYYRALSDKQHGSGEMTVKDFLNEKISFAEELAKMICRNDDVYTGYLKVLLTAGSLASAPYGFGGRAVLEEVFQYDKNKITLEIAKELQLSEKLTQSLDKDSTVGPFMEECILLNFDRILVNTDCLTPSIKQEIFDTVPLGGIPDELIQKLIETPFSPEHIDRIEKQKSQMRHVIDKLKEQNAPNIKDHLKYILSTKERDFVQICQ